MDEYLKAGKIASEALQYGKSLLKPGESIAPILDKIEDYIKKEGGEIAFPAQISLNSVAAHQCEIDNTCKLTENDLIKLDVGVSINGYIADNAITIAFDSKYDKLILASENALKKAISLATPGTTLKEIGTAIEKEIVEHGFVPVRNLTGHGLKKYTVHAPPQIPNIKNENLTELKEGDVIAIEPFASTGSGIVKESGQPTVFTVNKIKPVRSKYSKQAIRHINELKGLPFGQRWLERKMGSGQARFAIRDLIQSNIITGHPPLKDTNKGMVSQAEHTIIVKPKPLITTKNNKRI